MPWCQVDRQLAGSKALSKPCKLTLILISSCMLVSAWGGQEAYYAMLSQLAFKSFSSSRSGLA